MALAPIAALALVLVRSPAWQASLRAFAEALRSRLHHGLQSDAVRGVCARLDDALTFMDWSPGTIGVDLARVWDPELWLKFKEAIAADTPPLFWNAVWERIQYKAIIPQAGLAGDFRMSYAKFLQLLEAHRIKRIIVYGDMKTAIVEVPHPWCACVQCIARCVQVRCASALCASCPVLTVALPSTLFPPLRPALLSCVPAPALPTQVRQRGGRAWRLPLLRGQPRAQHQPADAQPRRARRPQPVVRAGDAGMEHGEIPLLC